MIVLQPLWRRRIAWLVDPLFGGVSSYGAVFGLLLTVLAYAVPAEASSLSSKASEWMTSPTVALGRFYGAPRFSGRHSLAAVSPLPPLLTLDSFNKKADAQPQPQAALSALNHKPLFLTFIWPQQWKGLPVPQLPLTLKGQLSTPDSSGLVPVTLTFTSESSPLPSKSSAPIR